MAREAAALLRRELRAAGLRDGTVVDLGCGSGVLGETMARAGYGVEGVDASRAMTALARARVPTGRFRTGSALRLAIPACVAVAAVGEVVNYVEPARDAGRGTVARRGTGGLAAPPVGERSAAAALRRWERVFRRAHRALAPGGVLLLDAAGPGRVRGGHARSFAEGGDWAVLVEAEEDRRRRRLVRRIATFRRVPGLAGGWRRTREVHHLDLYPPRDVEAALRRAGFRVQRLDGGYGRVAAFPGWTAWVARKATARA